ncbi:hypothetical protein A943_15615 [Bacillus sp. CPSM8]|nr:hypothetical protein A943_15615 [Bacillus sp. CPSM8]
MVFVNVLLTAAFLTGAFTGFLWTFSKEKSDEYFRKWRRMDRGNFTLFGWDFGVFLL